jgi:hypothetical protein
LAKDLRVRLRLAQYVELSFKLQCKLFQSGQTWLGMIGYCQKW